MRLIYILGLVLLFGNSLTMAQSLAQHYEFEPLNYTLEQEETLELKNPNTAMWLSVGPTVGTILLTGLLLDAEDDSAPFLVTTLSIGLLVSPALGYLYTQNWDDFWISTGIRLGGRLLMAGGTVMFLIGTVDSYFYEGEEGNNALAITGAVIAFGGGFLNLAITFRDFRRVRTRVHEYNEKLTQTSIRIAPAIDPVNKSLGLALRVNF